MEDEADIWTVQQLLIHGCLKRLIELVVVVVERAGAYDLAGAASLDTRLVEGESNCSRLQQLQFLNRINVGFH